MNIDTEGRLFFFEAVPEKSSEPQNKEPFDWSILFREAELDMTQFAVSTPQEIPLQVYDEQMSWIGKYPEAPYPIRIEAAAFDGKPVYFEIFGPWRTSPFRLAAETPLNEKVAAILLLSVFYGALIVCALLALKNLRLGRGDRKGAFRVAIFLLILKLVGWIFSVRQRFRSSIGEAKLLLTGIESALFWSCFVGLMYLALEPILRRRWPHRIISWSRLLSGDFKDPLVGRDILIGAMLGGIGLLLRVLILNFAGWIGMPPDMPNLPDPGSIGITHLGYGLVMQFSTALYGAFLITFLLLFLTLLFRRQWLGIAAGWVLLSTLAVFGEGVGISPALPGSSSSSCDTFCGLVFFGLVCSLLLLQSYFIISHFLPDDTELHCMVCRRFRCRFHFACRDRDLRISSFSWRQTRLFKFTPGIIPQTEQNRVKNTSNTFTILQTTGHTV